MSYKQCSSIRFLDSGSGTWTTILLGLASSRIGDEEGPVILEKSFFNLTLLGFVYEFLVISYDSLCDGLPDGINLGNIT